MPEFHTTHGGNRPADEFRNASRPGGERLCDACRRAGRIARYGEDDGLDPHIYSYGYRPEWEFLGAGPMFYGMEIEVGTLDPYLDACLAYNYLDPHNLGYLKEDASVDGFEIVTHPMSYEWAMEHFPWQMLPALSENGCGIDPSENGIHIHVSRDGFANAAHTYRWMKLLYRNADEVRRIARRDSSWGSFRKDCKRSQFQHVLKMNKDRDYLQRGIEEDATLCSRYNAINTTNVDTLEVRVFASTLRADRAQQALQLVASAVEYTRDTTSKDILAGAWKWPEFRAWVTSQATTYPQLAEVV